MALGEAESCPRSSQQKKGRKVFCDLVILGNPQEHHHGNHCFSSLFAHSLGKYSPRGYVVLSHAPIIGFLE